VKRVPVRGGSVNGRAAVAALAAILTFVPPMQLPSRRFLESCGVRGGPPGTPFRRGRRMQSRG